MSWIHLDDWVGIAVPCADRRARSRPGESRLARARPQPRLCGRAWPSAAPAQSRPDAGDRPPSGFGRDGAAAVVGQHPHGAGGRALARLSIRPSGDRPSPRGRASTTSMTVHRFRLTFALIVAFGSLRGGGRLPPNRTPRGTRLASPASGKPSTSTTARRHCSITGACSSTSTRRSSTARGSTRWSRSAGRSRAVRSTTSGSAAARCTCCSGRRCTATSRRPPRRCSTSCT